MDYCLPNYPTSYISKSILRSYGTLVSRASSANHSQPMKEDKIPSITCIDPCGGSSSFIIKITFLRTFSVSFSSLPSTVAAPAALFIFLHPLSLETRKIRLLLPISIPHVFFFSFCCTALLDLCSESSSVYVVMFVAAVARFPVLAHFPWSSCFFRCRIGNKRNGPPPGFFLHKLRQTTTKALNKFCPFK